jgi:hypothetical protein
MKKDSKIVIRPSEFWKDMMIYSILITIGVLILLFWNPEQYSLESTLWGFSLVFTTVFALLRMGMTHSKLDEALNFKYRIKLSKHNYKAQVLRVFFGPIIFWTSIESDYTSYETQNIFGAKGIGGYSTNTTYSKLAGAQTAVANARVTAKRQRKEYFEKKKVEKFKNIKA